MENFWAAWLHFLLVNGEAVHKSYSTVRKSAVVPWNIHRDTKQLSLIFFFLNICFVTCIPCWKVDSSNHWTIREVLGSVLTQ